VFLFIAGIGVAACGLDQTGALDVSAPDGDIDAHATPDAAGDATRDSGADGTIDAAKDADGAPDGDAGPGDVRADTSPDAPADAPIDALPDSCASTEDCTDGVDNDCNNLVDCADPACGSQGFACVPAVPSGWSLVAFDGTTRPACPQGYGPAADVVVDPSASPATCGCTCNVTTPPSCVTGSVAAAYGTTNMCTAGSGPFPNNDGACQPVSYTLAAYVRVTPLTPAGGTCSASPNTTVDTSMGLGRTCGAAGAFGGGCPAGGVCAPVATGPYAACITRAGASACAGAYTTKHAVGSGVTDTRTCSGCTCGPAPSASSCVNRAWNMYTSTDCSGTPLALTVDGNCDPTNTPSPSTLYQSSKYVATAQASCAAPTTSPTATGSLTITDLETVCCTP
jgi:hypothetical protein